MKIIKWVLNVLSWAVYACIICYLLVASPMIAGYRPVIVLSGSMEPTYRVGSMIYYKHVDFKDIQVGDAITFRAGEGGMVTHRVTAKSELSGTFTTKGDANISEDPNPVEYTDVLGKVWDVSIPYAGFFVGYSKNFTVIGGMAGIILLSILFDSLFPDKKKGKEEAADESGAEKENML